MREQVAVQVDAGSQQNSQQNSQQGSQQGSPQVKAASQATGGTERSLELKLQRLEAVVEAQGDRIAALERALAAAADAWKR